MSLKILNEKTDTDSHPYIAGYMGKQVGLYAPSLYDAKLKAVDHFKPSKKNAGLLWVELAVESEQ